MKKPTLQTLKLNAEPQDVVLDNNGTVVLTHKLRGDQRVVVVAKGGATINGFASFTIDQSFQYVKFIFDASTNNYMTY